MYIYIGIHIYRDIYICTYIYIGIPEERIKEAKESHYRGKRDLLQRQKRPTIRIPEERIKEAHLIIL
jgi:hypothetical protein